MRNRNAFIIQSELKRFKFDIYSFPFILENFKYLRITYNYHRPSHEWPHGSFNEVNVP